MISERDDSLASSVWRLGRFALGARVQEEEGIHLGDSPAVPGWDHNWDHPAWFFHRDMVIYG